MSDTNSTNDSISNNPKNVKKTFGFNIKESLSQVNPRMHISPATFNDKPCYETPQTELTVLRAP